MVYEDGILVNGPVATSTTLTLGALGISILGVLLQVLAGILLLRGPGTLPSRKGGGAWRRRSALWASLPGLWRVPDCFADPRFPLSLCDLMAVFPCVSKTIHEAPNP